MRHNTRKTVLGRDYNQRKALIRSLLNSLIKYGSITTTEGKAKAVKTRFDKLAARLVRDNSLHRLRLTASYLANPKNALRLKDGVLPLFKDKKTGFLTSIRLNPRRGDAATLIKLELPVKVEDFNKPVKKTKEVKSQKNTKVKKEK